MSNIVKTKFAGLLRGLLRRMDDGDLPQTPRTLAHTPPSHSMQPAIPATPQPEPVENLSSTMSSTAASTDATSSDELELPLHPILAGLPMDLRGKVIHAPPQGTTLVMPVEKILSQLAHGSVKITFGELRTAAPGIFVNSGGENDSRPVILPLNDILSRLHPSLLRRTTQKRVEVSEEISGPFGANAQGVSFTTAPLKPAQAARPLPKSVTPEKPISEKPLTLPVAPSPTFAAAQPKPAPLPDAPIPFTPRQVAPAPVPAMPHKNGNGNGNGNGIHDIFAPKNFDAVTAPPAPPAPTAALSGSSQPTISTTLGALMETWPEKLRIEITQLNLVNATVSLPVDFVEPALKRGRVAMTWQNVRAITQPQPGASAHDNVELELPLKVLAPLFFSRQKTAKPQQKLSVSEEIPNLFFGFPQPHQSAVPVETPKPATDIFARKNIAPQQTPSMPLPPGRPAAPVQQPPAKPATDIFFRKNTESPAPVVPPAPPVNRPPTPPLKPADAKMAETNFYVFGDDGSPKIDPTEFKRSAPPATDFLSRYATPEQIVERAMELPNVAGAIVALPDGLKVASEVRTTVNADTIAAFVPQIISRVNQATRELRMGDLNHLQFLVGMVQWEIFRVGGVFLAVFSDQNEFLPSAQLAQLAAQLERRK